MTRRLDFSYRIPDERLIAYSRLSVIDRLRWLDELRRFTLMVRAAPRVPPEDGGPALPAPGGGQALDERSEAEAKRQRGPHSP